VKYCVQKRKIAFSWGRKRQQVKHSIGRKLPCRGKWLRAPFTMKEYHHPQPGTFQLHGHKKQTLSSMGSLHAARKFELQKI
jgi:hypothetical protein